MCFCNPELRTPYCNSLICQNERWKLTKMKEEKLKFPYRKRYICPKCGSFAHIKWVKEHIYGYGEPQGNMIAICEHCEYSWRPEENK